MLQTLVHQILMDLIDFTNLYKMRPYAWYVYVIIPITNVQYAYVISPYVDLIIRRK